MHTRTPFARRAAIVALVALLTTFPTASAWLGAPLSEDATPQALVLTNGTAPVTVTFLRLDASPDATNWTWSAAPAGPAYAMRFHVAEGERDAEGHWRYSVSDGSAGPAPGWSVVVLHDAAEP